MRVVVLGPLVPVVSVVVVVLVVLAALAVVLVVVAAVVVLLLASAVVVRRWFAVLALGADRVDASIPGNCFRTPAPCRLCRTMT